MHGVGVPLGDGADITEEGCIDENGKIRSDRPGAGDRYDRLYNHGRNRHRINAGNRNPFERTAAGAGQRRARIRRNGATTLS
jgi:hypothetical protein